MNEENKQKFKVIGEYEHFYLGESEKGYKECFSKFDNKIDSEGYITKRRENNYVGGIALSPDKVNRKFNPIRINEVI